MFHGNDSIVMDVFANLQNFCIPGDVIRNKNNGQYYCLLLVTLN